MDKRGDWTIAGPWRQAPLMSAETTMQADTAPAPLASVLESFALAVEPVEPVSSGLAEAVGRTLAADVCGPSPSGAAEVVRLAGARLRRIDVALMASLGVERVAIRVPRVQVLPAADDAGARALARLIADAINAEGADAQSERISLEAAMRAADVDVVVALDSPDGKHAAMLARGGRMSFPAVAIRPGGGTALGHANGRPVLLLPDALDAALAGWLTVGRRLLARLAFRLIEEQPFPLELARPLTSPAGVTDVVPVRRRASTVEPLASGAFGPSELARSDGWILVPADSEGHPAGARVVVRPWP